MHLPAPEQTRKIMVDENTLDHLSDWIRPEALQHKRATGLLQMADRASILAPSLHPCIKYMHKAETSVAA